MQLKSLCLLVVVLLPVVLAKSHLKSEGQHLTTQQRPHRHNQQANTQQTTLQSNTQQTSQQTSQQTTSPQVGNPKCQPCPCKGANDINVVVTPDELRKCIKDAGYHNNFPVSSVSWHHTHGNDLWTWTQNENKELIDGKDWGFYMCYYNGGGKKHSKEQKIYRHVAIGCPTDESYVRVGEANTDKLIQKKVDVSSPLSYGWCKPKVGNKVQACRYSTSGNCMDDGCVVVRHGQGNQVMSSDDQLYNCRQPNSVEDLKFRG